MAERLKMLEDQVQTAQAAAEEARKDRDAAAEAARREAEEAAKRLEAIENQVQAAQAAAEDARKDRDAAVEAAKDDAGKAAKRVHALEEEARRMRRALRDRDETAQRAKAEFDRMRADQGVLLSMLQARSDELTALRASHGQLADEKRGLEELIGKLTPRLQEAATQLRSLALLPGEPAAEARMPDPRSPRDWPRKDKGRER